MTQETGKSMLRRSGDSRYATRWITGNVIDIGSGDDSLARYQHMFPLVRSVRSYDVEDGDAMILANVKDEQYDTVHSSHCLEHTQDPFLAMRHWLRVCKIGGYLVITVPDFEQYEQGFWPSRFNGDHKWSFSIDGRSQHAHHVILLDDSGLRQMCENKAKVIKLELVERGYVYGAVRHDQSLSAACEPTIEIVCRKIQ